MRKGAATPDAGVQLDDRLALTVEEVLDDYRIAVRSRIAGLIGTREAHSDRATFGIFGDGKEVAQLAMAKAFRPGDVRAGYYRDQTFMFATGMTDLPEFFAQLYAHADHLADPASGGRQMNSHFATRFLDEHGRFRHLVDEKHSTSDISPTGGQMARLLGLAYASKLYRNEPALAELGGNFSMNGNEVAFGTIGNAGTSEGVFFEAMNAAGVLQVPMAVSVWDDEYGISVPNEYQTTKSSISEAMRGFEWDEKYRSGLDIYVVPGWDYASLCRTYLTGIERVRREHVPALFHVTEMTQPLGHSSSGSHERYKSPERLQWEREHDPIKRMGEWMLEEGIASSETLEQIEKEERKSVEQCRQQAWSAYIGPIQEEQQEALGLLERLDEELGDSRLQPILDRLRSPRRLYRRVIMGSAVGALTLTRGHRSPQRQLLEQFVVRYGEENVRRYNSHLYSESEESPLLVPERKPRYSPTSDVVAGRVVLQRCFDHNLKKDARLFIVGEDVGKLGDVNLVFQGLQEKYGELRVTDTGIREATILGQGIGAALRGLRPLVDIQYLDYLICALQVMSDDLATLHYRTRGGQKAPVIIRTKGHRLDGIWHSGSAMAMILHSCRGIYLCVPRNMTQAAGMYNTLLQGDNPALVVEVLGGYRDKERVPDNLGSFTVPLGMPEILRPGEDVTIVTYGECCHVALEACDRLESLGVDVELIDVQTLNPFDLDGMILDSLDKTNSILFLDEDVPGGASAFMMQEVLEVQGGWELLDSAPRTMSAKANRSPYGVDGGYFSKPNVEEIVMTVYEMASERRPSSFPPLFG
ncbi:MAG: thiamine pyrophosphate-dependent enzyme [Actinomycetota bacterium]|nr:thiamine pyrophosphate-dependent enzyme [Actinomycetota bacterium]